MAKFIYFTDDYDRTHLVNMNGIVISTHDMNTEYSIKIEAGDFSGSKKYQSKERRDEIFRRLIEKIEDKKYLKKIFYL